jgi:hypothetical protein
VGLDQEEEAAERERCIQRKQEIEQIVSGFGSGRVGICIVYRVDFGRPTSLLGFEKSVTITGLNSES